MRRLSALLLLAAACVSPRAGTRTTTPAATAATVAEAPDVPAGSDADADSMLVDVRHLDSTIVVDLRYGTPANFTGAPLPGYLANRALLRREAAAALARVQHRLADDALSLHVFDAYRPVRATRAMMAWAERENRMALVRDGYIASRSRHNLGLAVDVSLADAVTGRPLDMGTPWDTFSAAAHTANATGAAAANRRRLVQAMAAEGFTNYEKEWWHFSYAHDRPFRFDVPIR